MAFVSAVCMARSRRGGKRSNNRQPKGKLTGAAQVGKIPNADLVSQFSEDIKDPSLRKRKEDKRDGGAMGIDLPWMKFDVNKISEMKREEVLDLLVRGAWVGIGILVGYFLVVHFIIVRDLLPA